MLLKVPLVSDANTDGYPALWKKRIFIESRKLLKVILARTELARQAITNHIYLSQLLEEHEREPCMYGNELKPIRPK